VLEDALRRLTEVGEERRSDSARDGAVV